MPREQSKSFTTESALKPTFNKGRVNSFLPKLHSSTSLTLIYLERYHNKLYRKTPLIQLTMGHINPAVLTGWPQGRFVMKIVNG